MKKKFFWKSFVSFSLVWSFLILLISGIVLYIAPPGRVSNWSNWVLFGFSKGGWQAIHTIFSLTFVFLSVFHLIVFNWKVLWFYFVSKTSKGLNKQKELIVSIALIIVVFLGTYFNVQPFKAVMDFSEWTTESWETNGEQAPVPHAELLTIKELSGKYVKMSSDSILLLIREKGLIADSTGQTISKISELNNLTPAKLYSIIFPASHNKSIKTENKIQLQGLGRKTINDISKELGKNVNDVIEVLRKNNISAIPEDKIKTVAERTGKVPTEIMKIIEQ